jgi:hypothetical protein
MSTIGWIIVAVVVIVVLAAVAVGWRSRRRSRLGERAVALRAEAHEHAVGIDASRHEAREAAVRADEARVAAEDAQRQADTARLALAQEEATQEDRLREADRIDPTGDAATEAEAPPATPGGAHRAPDRA